MTIAIIILSSLLVGTACIAIAALRRATEAERLALQVATALRQIAEHTPTYTIRGSVMDVNSLMEMLQQ